jgi:hypothetical protein
MLLNNYAIRNDSQARALGGNLDPTYNYHLNKMMTFYVGDNDVVSVTDTTSQPAQGYRPPYALVLAPKEGGMSMWNGGTGTATASGVSGLFGTADLAGIGTISNAAAGLIVEMVATIAGLGGLTASVIGQLQASATLAGSGTLTAAQSALAGMTATLLGTGLLSDAQQQALGNMTANIYVNQSQATVAEIVDAVWNALAAEYNISGTMGNKLNGAGSAGDPWTTDISAYNTANTAGKILKDRLSKGQFLGLK